MSKSSGAFGKLAAEYDSMRPTYPKKAISIVHGAINSRHPNVLDIGCGCDIDRKMLKAALKRPLKNVCYKQGSAQKLPFSNAAFDAATAFIAFHWFMNKKAIREIRRVLKPQGILFIVQPRYAAIQKDFRIILERELRRKLPKNYKTGKEIIPFLDASGFKTRKRVVKTDVKYTINPYLRLLQSYSLWNYVPMPRREEMREILKMHFRKKLRNGFIRNMKDVEVIIATKSR